MMTLQNRPQIHSQNLMLTLMLTLDTPLDARCVYTLKAVLLKLFVQFKLVHFRTLPLVLTYDGY